MRLMDIEQVAQELMRAYETGQMVESAPSSRPGFDLDAAYAIEARLKQMREAAGHKAAGRKVGYANKAVWRIMKLETLVWGHMYDDTVHYAANNSATLSLPRARSLKIEPEIMFGLKQPIAGQLEPAAALEACDWVAFGFEVIDCPYPGWQFQPGDFVASFGLHAALVVGERRPVKAEEIPTLLDELAKFKVRMMKGSEFVEEGSGKNALRNPAACLAELGSAILKRTPAEPLSAGEVISTGTLTTGHLAQAGDVWAAELSGISLPNLTLKFQ